MCNQDLDSGTRQVFKAACFGYEKWNETFVVQQAHSFAVGVNLGSILALNQPWDVTVHSSPVPLLSPYHRLTGGHQTTSYCFMQPAVKLPVWITAHLYINTSTWFRSPWSCCFRYEAAMKHTHHAKSALRARIWAKWCLPRRLQLHISKPDVSELCHCKYSLHAYICAYPAK